MTLQGDAVGAQIARAVRERRERLGLTLRALGQRSGVSPSMISDVERQAKSPTVATLAALAAALEVPLATLVAGASTHPRLHVARAGEASERLAPALPGSKVEFRRIAVPPRTVVGPFPAHPAGTIEHIHVAAGRLRVTLGDAAATLATGDGCACVADAPHGFDNRDGDVEALLYLVIERP